MPECLTTSTPAFYWSNLRMTMGWRCMRSFCVITGSYRLPSRMPPMPLVRLAPNADIIVTGMMIGDAMDGSNSSRASAMTTARRTRQSSWSLLAPGRQTGSALSTRGVMCFCRSCLYLIACCAKYGDCYLQRVRRLARDIKYVRFRHTARRVMSADGSPLAGCRVHLQGLRDGEIHEPKDTPFPQVAGAHTVGERDRVRHRSPCLRSVSCP